MTPIVFCASCRPCPNDIAADDTHCPIRNPTFASRGFARRNTHSSASMSRKRQPKPTSGEATIGMTTFSTTACQLTCPLEARAAPHRPPISACEDDDGRPKYQVMRFQVIAPTTAAKTTDQPSVVAGAVMMLPDGVGDLRRDQRAEQVEDRGERQRRPRASGPGSRPRSRWRSPRRGSRWCSRSPARRRSGRRVRASPLCA